MARKGKAWKDKERQGKTWEGKARQGCRKQASKHQDRAGQGRSDELAPCPCPCPSCKWWLKMAFADACAGGEAHAHGLMLSVDKAHAPPGLAGLAHALAPGSADPQGQAVTDGR